MAQRKEPHDSLDDFPTPPWATRALCEFLGREHTEDKTCWEPACGEGHMARPLTEYFEYVRASDIHDYGGKGCHVDDFLMPYEWPSFDWIITNPPFRLAEKFVLIALQRATIGVAMLVRTAFLESIGRYERLFSTHRPTWILQFTERVPMLKGRLERDASTATAYCWIIWTLPLHNCTTKFTWIPPCRAKFERAEDYA